MLKDSKSIKALDSLQWSELVDSLPEEGRQDLLKELTDQLEGHSLVSVSQLQVRTALQEAIGKLQKRYPAMRTIAKKFGIPPLNAKPKYIANIQVGDTLAEVILKPDGTLVDMYVSMVLDKKTYFIVQDNQQKLAVEFPRRTIVYTR